MTVSDGTVIRTVANLLFPDNSIAQMVFWFLSDFTTDQQDNDVANQVEEYVENILAQIAGIISSGLVCDLSEVNEMVWNAVDNVWETYRLIGIYTPGTTFTGSGDALPRQTAATMTGNTGRPKTRGRKFFPGWVESSNVDGVVQSAQLTALAGALAQYLADETISAGNDLLVGVGSEVTGQFHEFTDGSANSIFGTQRRRKQGVGA